jgi:hypothetical protein
MTLLFNSGVEQAWERLTGPATARNVQNQASARER